MLILGGSQSHAFEMGAVSRVSGDGGGGVGQIYIYIYIYIDFSYIYFWPTPPPPGIPPSRDDLGTTLGTSLGIACTPSKEACTLSFLLVVFVLICLLQLVPCHLSN